MFGGRARPRHGLRHPGDDPVHELVVRRALGVAEVRQEPELLGLAGARVQLAGVHGDKDLYFPPEHARQLYEGAREPKELWLIPGFGHAERATDDELVDRIVAWVTEAVTRPAAAAGHEPTATSQ